VAGYVSSRVLLCLHIRGFLDVCVLFGDCVDMLLEVRSIKMEADSGVQIT
jgi:hypothetical protein